MGVGVEEEGGAAGFDGPEQAGAGGVAVCDVAGGVKGAPDREGAGGGAVAEAAPAAGFDLYIGEREAGWRAGRRSG